MSIGRHTTEGGKGLGTTLKMYSVKLQGRRVHAEATHDILSL